MAGPPEEEAQQEGVALWGEVAPPGAEIRAGTSWRVSCLCFEYSILGGGFTHILEMFFSRAGQTGYISLAQCV